MKTDYREFMKTGMVGAYQPRRAVLQRCSDGIVTIFRDAVHQETDDRITAKRMLTVGDRRFRVTSVFPAEPAAMVTDKYLAYIDSELKKEVHTN